jgi:hypothetical protein
LHGTKEKVASDKAICQQLALKHMSRSTNDIFELTPPMIDQLIKLAGFKFELGRKAEYS